MTFHALRVIAAIVVFAISPLVITLAVSISSVFAYALFVWMHFRWTTPGILLDFSEAFCFALDDTLRSEEHTSELQSLMRISYAVFCLKKKKKKNNQQTTDHTAKIS